MSNSTWLWAIVNGVEYDLTSGSILYQEHGDGFGMPPLHRMTQRGPQQHGETNRDFRLDPRTITLIAGFARLCEADVYAARRMLLDIFKPSNTAIKLRWDLSNGAVRQIDTFYDGSMTLPLGRAAAGNIGSQNQSGQTPNGRSGGVFQRTAIDLFCPDPTFYDPAQQTVVMTNGAFSGGLTVPMPVPFSIGINTINLSTTIAYAGDWLSYPVIRLTGPITNPIVTNVTTGEVLDFTGSSIDAGDWWDIDLSYGAKTVVDSTGTSRIAALTSASDLGTWHLAPAPDASATYNNVITITGSGTTGVSAAQVSWYNRYLGF